MIKTGLLITFESLLLVAAAKTLEHGSIDSIVYVGTANGLSYFADRAVERNWIAAKTFCNEASMRLASINTEEQLALLTAHNVTGSDHFWTAGRDATTLSQFAWDHNAETLNGTLLHLRKAPPISNCLTFFIDDVGSNPCTTAYYTLCELAIGR